MRFFVMCTPDDANNPPYILAEIVQDGSLEQDRATSIASAVAGDRAEIVTRDELMDRADGRVAIAAWEELDDSSFDRESVALEEGERGPGRVAYLRVVRDPDVAPRISRQDDVSH